MVLGSVHLCYLAGFNPYKSIVKQYFSLTINQPYKSVEADLIPADQSVSPTYTIELYLKIYGTPTLRYG